MGPYAPCMEYLPTSTINLGDMWANIPYMEHLGMGIVLKKIWDFPPNIDDRNFWLQTNHCQFDLLPKK